MSAGDWQDPYDTSFSPPLVRFFAIKKDVRTERYWLADQFKLVPLLAASFYMDRKDAEKELAQMVLRGQHPKAVIIELEVRQV